MGILLRLGGAQLGPAVVGQHLGENVRERERRKCLRNGEGLIVLRHRGAAHRGPAAGIEAVESLHAERRHDLPHPVAPVIEEEDPVAILDRRHRQPVAVMHERPHELVGLAALVGGLHRQHRVLGGDADTMGDGVVRRAGAIPALVAVHAVVAPRERCDIDAAARDPAHVEQQRAHDLGAEGRGRVAAIEEAMNGDVRHLEPHGQFDTGEQVTVERVHAAGTEESHQVQRAAGLSQPATELLQHGQLIELTPFDALRDAHEVLRHHPPRTEVEVPDFAVAHLSRGKPDGEFTGIEESAGAAVPEPGPGGRVRHGDRVALLFGPVTPAVQHHEHDWSAMPGNV